MDTMTLTVDVAGTAECCGGLDFGLQSSSGELVPGTPTGDGALRYVCEAALRPRPDGSATCSGEFVHGPSGERFLYVSCRREEGGPWVRRTKILLPARIESGTRRLSARVRDVGRTRVQFEAEWTAE